jgi:hypothetical protein
MGTQPCLDSFYECRFGALDIGFFLPSMSYSPFQGSQHRKHAEPRPECKRGEYDKKVLL